MLSVIKHAVNTIFSFSNTEHQRGREGDGQKGREEQEGGGKGGTALGTGKVLYSGNKTVACMQH